MQSTGRSYNPEERHVNFYSGNARDQRAEMARVIVILGENRNAISAPLHRLVRPRIFFFILRILKEIEARSFAGMPREFRGDAPCG